MVITVDEKGRERKWGPLSGTTAWRAGSFWEDMKMTVKVFIQRGEERKEVGVEKRTQGGRKIFWFCEKPSPHPQERQDVGDDQPIQEAEDGGMQEDTPEEKQKMEMTGLEERIAALERENGELKNTLREMEKMIVQQENTTKEMVQQLSTVKTAITQIAEHAQRQILFNESAKTSMAELVQEVQKHQNNFQEVVRVLQIHEEHILKSGTASEEMAQRINALIQDSQNKNMWIGSLMRENQEQSQVLRQHHVGQQVLAEVIKTMANQYQHQQTHQ